jgi:hypothetical protein
MGFKPEIRRQFLQHFAKNRDLLAKHRFLIESQIQISKNKTKNRFNYGIKKSLWRNYDTAKTALENPDLITAGGQPRIRARKTVADLHSLTGKFANKMSDDKPTLTQPSTPVRQTVEEIPRDW